MRRLVTIGIVAAACRGCMAQCDSWEHTQYPGPNDAVNALCVFDADGAGPTPPEIVAGGAFDKIGVAWFVRVASWSDTNGAWSALPVSTPTVDRAVAFPASDGTNILNLISGRQVRQISNGVAVQRPSMNDGTILAAAGLPNPFGEYDLVIGGTFNSAGGFAAARLAVWQEYRWWPLGGTPDGAVHALLTIPDGNGVALIAAGEFTQIGTVAANRIAKWNGATWEPLGAGIAGGGAAVKCLAWAPRADGGIDLYAGGSFTQAGGGAAPSLARWDGVQWAPAPAGLTVGASGAAVINSLVIDRTNSRVYAGGTFNRVGGVSANVASWVGNAWQAVGGPMTGEVRAMEFEPSTGNLLAGGTIVGAGRGVVRLVNGAWAALADGFDQPPMSLTVRRATDGSEELLAGGKFTHVDRATARGVVRRVNGRWEELGGGIPSARPVTLLTAPDNRVYALGWFDSAGGAPARDIAVWDGTTWSQVGTGLARYRFLSEPRAMTIASNGDLIVAGGGAASPTDTTRRGVLRWTGTEWISLGDSPDSTTEYRSLATLSNGDLVLGGAFSAIGGVARANIARWDGNEWQPFGPGANGRVNCILPLPGGGFVAGGRFTSIGGIEARGAAIWDGASWRPMSLPASTVDGEVPTLAFWDRDGAGPEDPVIVCGNGPYQWNGNSWQPIPGISVVGLAESIVNGNNGSLSVAGSFTGSAQGFSRLVPPTITIISQPWSGVRCGAMPVLCTVSARASDRTEIQFRWQMEVPPFSNQWTDEIPGSSASDCILELDQTLPIHETRYRCILTACGVSVTTIPNFVDICDGDADCDLDADSDDIIVFFEAWDQGWYTADVNDDGGCDGDDIIQFFASWDEGC